MRCCAHLHVRCRVRGLEPSGEKAEPRVRAPKFEELYEEETRRTRERVVTEESYANRMERCVGTWNAARTGSAQRATPCITYLRSSLLSHRRTSASRPSPSQAWLTPRVVLALPYPRRAQHQHLGLIGLSPAKSNARKGTAEGGQQEGMEDDSMSFSISGSRGNVYTITIAETPKCTCPYVFSGHLSLYQA